MAIFITYTRYIKMLLWITSADGNTVDESRSLTMGRSANYLYFKLNYRHSIVLLLSDDLILWSPGSIFGSDES